MAKYDMNINNIMLALQAVQALPDEDFLPLMTDEVNTAIINQVYVPIHTRNSHLNADDTKRLFGISSLDDIEELRKLTRRQLAERTIVFYKARYDITPDRNKGALRNATQCFGMGNNAEAYIHSICNKAGIPHIPQGGIGGDITTVTVPSEPEPKKVKTEQQKDAEQDAGRKAVEAHHSGKRKSVKETSAEQPAPDRSVPTQAQPSEQPDNKQLVIEPRKIGTAFLTNGFQLVLYKPSEAYKKPERRSFIDGYYYEDTLVLFYGQASSYKSWWAIWEGVSLAIGKELCGMPIKDGTQKILYVSLEMTAKDIADRLHMMTKDLSPAEQQLVDDNFVIMSAEDESKIRANKKNIYDALRDVCREKGIKTIYIDSLADFIAGLNIRDEIAMGDVVTDMRNFILQNHVSFRIIHHGVKPVQTSEGKSDGSMAGIHTIRDLADQVYAMKVMNENEIRITNDMTKDSSAKPRYGKALTFTVKFQTDEQDGTFSFKRLQDNETTSHIEKVKIILTAIEEEQGIIAGDLRKKCGNFTGYAQVLEGLIKAGTVIVDSVKGGSGSNKKCHYTAEYWNDYINPDKK